MPTPVFTPILFCDALSFCRLLWFSFSFCFFVLPSLTTCHPVYIPPLFAVLSPFSTEFIHAFHCFLSILHPNAFIMPRSFAKTPLTISLTSGRGRPAEVKTTKRSIQELPAISAFIQARIRSPLTKCKKYRGCARRSHPRTYLYDDSKSLHSPECREIMVALLDDTLLDYRTTYPFLLVVDVVL